MEFSPLIASLTRTTAPDEGRFSVYTTSLMVANNQIIRAAIGVWYAKTACKEVVRYNRIPRPDLARKLGCAFANVVYSWLYSFEVQLPFPFVLCKLLEPPNTPHPLLYTVDAPQTETVPVRLAEDTDMATTRA